jgi:hypothetical protein
MASLTFLSSSYFYGVLKLDDIWNYKMDEGASAMQISLAANNQKQMNAYLQNYEYEIVKKYFGVEVANGIYSSDSDYSSQKDIIFGLIEGSIPSYPRSCIANFIWCLVYRDSRNQFTQKGFVSQDVANTTRRTANTLYVSAFNLGVDILVETYKKLKDANLSFEPTCIPDYVNIFGI